MNPLNVLIDIIPAKYRKIVYALVALLSFGYSIWLASHGDWTVFVGSLITGLTTTTAAVNTNVDPDVSGNPPFDAGS